MKRALISWCSRCSKPISNGADLCEDCDKIMKIRKKWESHRNVSPSQKSVVKNQKSVVKKCEDDEWKCISKEEIKSFLAEKLGIEASI